MSEAIPSDAPSFVEVCYQLSKETIPFAVHFTNGMFTVSVSKTLNNAQLATIVNLGGNMGPDGTVYIIGNLDLNPVEGV